MTAPLNLSERRALREKARTATINALYAFGGEAQRSEIKKWALDNGNFTLRELEAPPPERADPKYQGAVDHRLSWTLTNLKRDGLLEKPTQGTWRLTRKGTSEAASMARVSFSAQPLAKPASPERLAELQAMSYRRYLKTPEWRNTRDAALLRAGNACSLDATHTGTLDVHHRSYERVGAELSCDVAVLCRSCHKLHHEHYGLPRRNRAAPSRVSHPIRRLLASLAPAILSRDTRP